jgi:hypothetical protein
MIVLNIGTFVATVALALVLGGIITMRFIRKRRK